MQAFKELIAVARVLAVSEVLQVLTKASLAFYQENKIQNHSKESFFVATKGY